MADVKLVNQALVASETDPIKHGAPLIPPPVVADKVHRHLNGKKDIPPPSDPGVTLPGPTLKEAMAAQKALESKEIDLPLPPSDVEVNEASGNCPSTCYGASCDYWVASGYTCDTMTKTYKCDCSGCSCGAAVPSAAPIKSSGTVGNGVTTNFIDYSHGPSNLLFFSMLSLRFFFFFFFR